MQTTRPSDRQLQGAEGSQESVRASPWERNTGLPQSRRQVRGRSTFMRKWQVAGCSAEEEKREREPTSSRAHLWASCPLVVARSPSTLCLTEVPGSTWKWSQSRTHAERCSWHSRYAPRAVRVKEDVRENPEYSVGLRMATAWQGSYRSAFGRRDIILQQSDHARKGYGEFLKFLKESAFMFL